MSRTSVRMRAFDPDFDDERQRFEVSTYRITGLLGAEVQQIARDRISGPVKGRADIQVALVHKHPELHVVVDEPPPRHAIILGWPGTPDEGKELRKMLQTQLAADASRQLIDAEPIT